MVDITITDPVSKVGMVLKAKDFEDAVCLLRANYSFCVGFRKFIVTIEWNVEE